MFEFEKGKKGKREKGNKEVGRIRHLVPPSDGFDGVFDKGIKG